MTEQEKKLIELLRQDKTKEAIKVIKGGINPNFTTNNVLARSPIYLAGSRDNVEMVRFLVEECNVPIDNEMAAYFSISGSFSCSFYLAQRLRGKK